MSSEERDFTNFTIGSLLERITARFPDKEALTFQDRRFTYSELEQQSSALAQKLLALGLGPGDKVGINFPNWPEFVISFLAAVRIGAVAVPLSTRYREYEIRHILRDSTAKALFTVSSFNKFDYLSTLERIRPDLPDLKHIIASGEEVQAGILPLESILAESAEDRNFPAVEDEALAAILYTSGTTGAAKGVMLSHRSLVGNALSVSKEILRIRPEDVLLLFIPLSHSGGITTLLWGLSTGARLVLVDIFRPKETLETIAREKISVVHGVPTAWIKLLEEAEACDLSALRLGVMGAAPCPKEVVREVSEKMKLDLRIAYGLTETAPLLCVTRAEDDPEKKAGTVGRALPDVKLKVVDEEGKELPPGEVGELLCKGYNVMQGYFRDPERTAEAFTPDGWLHTGDLAAMDEEGYVRIVGRKKEMIVRGGFKIYPREVEEFLFAQPGISNAAVIGVPHPIYGESVWAYIVPKDGTELDPEEIIALCRSKIANFKVPEKVRIVQDLPMTGSGKVQKFLLQEAALAELKAKSPDH